MINKLNNDSKSSKLNTLALNNIPEISELDQEDLQEIEGGNFLAGVSIGFVVTWVILTEIRRQYTE